MRVKVHPHKPMVDNGSEACISITPDKKYGRAYYMGTVAMTDVSFRIHESGLKKARDEQVRNVHAWAVGDLTHEAVERLEPSETLMKKMVAVTYHYNTGRFFTLDSRRGDMVCFGTDVTDCTFRAVYVCGPTLYVSKDGLT